MRPQALDQRLDLHVVELRPAHHVADTVAGRLGALLNPYRPFGAKSLQSAGARLVRVRIQDVAIVVVGPPEGRLQGTPKGVRGQSGVRVSAHLAITERHRVPEARIGLSEEGGRRNVQGHLPRPPEPAALRAAPIRVEFDQQPTASHLLSLRRAAVTRGDQDRSFVLPGAVFDNGRFLALAPAEVRAIGKRGRGQAQDKKRRNGRTPHPRTLGAPRLRGQPDRS